MFPASSSSRRGVSRANNLLHRAFRHLQILRIPHALYLLPTIIAYAFNAMQFLLSYDQALHLWLNKAIISSRLRKKLKCPPRKSPR
jgi:hypothetical protein